MCLEMSKSCRHARRRGGLAETNNGGGYGARSSAEFRSRGLGNVAFGSFLGGGSGATSGGDLYMNVVGVGGAVVAGCW